MRLMCPNCEAQYEVSDSVIPLHGRDVQCSNCGQTWFQTHPQAEPEAPADEDDVAFDADEGQPDPETAPWDDDSAEAPAEESVDEPEPDLASVAEPAPDMQELPGVTGSEGAQVAEAAAFAEEMAEEGVAAEEVAAEVPQPDETTPAAEVPAEPEAADPEPAAAVDDGDAAEDDSDESSAVPVAAGILAAAASEPKRRSLDDAVLSVLREEAEREAKARRAAGGIETQTDMNLAAAEPLRATQGLDSLPKLRVQTQAESHSGDLSVTKPRRPVEDLSTPFVAEPEEQAAQQRTSRRDLLPDIESFSSSLQDKGDSTAAGGVMDQTSAPPVRRGGFRRGFLLVILLAAIVFGLYAAAPAIGARFPAAVPMLTQFVGLVDKGRVMVDQLMQSTLDRLKADEKPAE